MFKPNEPGYFQVPDHELSNLSRPPTAPARKRQHAQALWCPRGWRFGILNGSILALLVFLFNVTVTLVLRSNLRSNDNGNAVLFEGDCETSRKLNTELHLVINILSTLLLSASNYGMQCVSAPTRKEIDKAHHDRRWLDIGVLSVRNLGRISWQRKWLWLPLGASSLPLHLFYNSAVYPSTFTSDYVVFLATETMLSSTATDQYLGLTQTGNQIDYYAEASRMYQSALASNLTRLDVKDCIDTYGNTFISTYRSVILVTSDSKSVPYSVAYTAQSQATQPNAPCNVDPFGWVCGHFSNDRNCNPTKLCFHELSELDRNDWRPVQNAKIDYCLSDPIEQRCKVEFSYQIAYVVVAFNFVKAAALTYIFLMIKEYPLMTIGDAVSSFQRIPDDTTKGFCLMGATDVVHWKKTHPGGLALLPPAPKKFDRTRQRWSSAVSRGRWAICMLLYVLILAVCVYFLFHGLFGRLTSPRTLIGLGIGAIDSRTFIYGVDFSGLLANVFLANSPQVILSCIYYTYNAIFTCFALASEWNSYASERKGLRVSSMPSGAQRSTYFLQLPYRWSLPLLVLSGVLHWLVSQSIFLVSIHFDHEALRRTFVNGTITQSDENPMYDDLGGWYGTNEYISCGYSPIAILATTLLGIGMVSTVVLIGRRRFKNGGTPVAASCSASISACCHLFHEATPSLETESYSAQLPVNPSTPSSFTTEPEGRVPLLLGKRGSSKIEWSETATESGEEAAYLPLRWGAMKTTNTMSDSAGDETAIGHCAFSSRKVDIPQHGRLYAGVPRLRNV